MSTDDYGFWALLAGDYEALYRGRTESRGVKGALLALARFATNPSLHAVVVIRIANAAPTWSGWVWRQLLVWRFAIDWAERAKIGPGLMLPHPVGIVFAGDMGSNVAIAQNVTLGGDWRGRLPALGDNVRIYPGAVLVSAVIGDGSSVGANAYVSAVVGERCVIGPNTHVNRDLPARSVVTNESKTRSMQSA